MVGRALQRLLSLNAESVAFLRNLLSSHRKALAIALGGSLTSAAFEGSTMGIFALALHTLAGDPRGFAAEYGAAGALMEGWYETLGRDKLALLLIGLAVASQLLRSGLRFVSDWAVAHLQAEVEGQARRRIFRQYMAMTYGQIRSYKVGDLASQMQHVTSLGQALYRSSLVLGHVFLLAAYLVVLLWLSWAGTLLAAVGMVLASLSLRWLMRRIRAAASAYRTRMVELSERTFELLSGVRLIRSFARERYATGKVDQVIGRVVDAQRRGRVWQGSLSPVIDSLAVLGVGAVLVAGFLFLGTEEPARLTRFATFLFVLYRLAPRLSAINKTWGLVHSHLPFVERTAEFLRVDDKQLAPVGGEPYGGLSRGIVFEGVGLRYADREAWALDDVSFELERGQMLALVGQSGSGKSSVADLLLRLYEPDRGRVLVDGRDLRELDWGDWRSHIGVVSQDTFLLNETIEENIAFGNQSVSRAEIEQAARGAHAHDFVERLPQGYATIVGDEGYRLSGGERQRLAIARAILGQPELLILDEATSDLDSDAERQIQETLARLRSNRTLVTIAHRLSTIAMADQILVLEAGRIVERGSHAELLSSRGAYARLWGLQSAGDAGAGAEPTSP